MTELEQLHSLNDYKVNSIVRNNFTINNNLLRKTMPIILLLNRNNLERTINTQVSKDT